ncbi:MAG: phosphoribosylglycinamide formyltransferase [Candidatus Kapabacteria bacterium]|nr:phosphoribosylglycinamide formyltransferase [Ignavibacteriota bacterium]MCW5884586.1 phosphoribosylglycinamide formyltransferase [Candidatus Kapabacteria bacterium]
MKTFNIAFFASHGGSNMQAILDAIKDGRLKSNPAVLITNNSKSGACEKAAAFGLLVYHVSSVTHPDDNERAKFIIEILEKFKIDLIVLAGYMKKLPSEVIARMNGRVLNIHPALLPKFGGEGMYGINVHKAVIEAGNKISGATVHLVESEYDRGRILLQKEVVVLADDSPETLAERVLKAEHKLYPNVIELLEKEEIIT